jgi:enoyl-CoA hydratase
MDVFDPVHPHGYDPAMVEALVLTEQRGAVLVITLNRPEVRNAIDRAIGVEVAAALDRLDGDDDLRVGVLVGAGKGFSAGMDLKAFAAGESPLVPDRGFAGMVEQGCRKPLIAAVEGFALAGGLEIALSCDIIVAARDAQIGIPETSIGLFAGSGAVFRLARHIPWGKAMELALTAEPISGEEAHRWGLVARLAEPGEALGVAVALAERIAQNAPLGVEASKQIMWDMVGLSEAELWSHQEPLIRQVFGSADALEGATSFAEKRRPTWTGR